MRHAALYSRGIYNLPARHGRFRRDPSTRRLPKDAGLSVPLTRHHTQPRYYCFLSLRPFMLIFPLPLPPFLLPLLLLLPLPFPPLQRGIRALKVAGGRGSREPSRVGAAVPAAPGPNTCPPFFKHSHFAIYFYARVSPSRQQICSPYSSYSFASLSRPFAFTWQRPRGEEMQTGRE